MSRLALVLGGIFGFWITKTTLRPAQLSAIVASQHHRRLTLLSVTWRYRSGQRPIAVIVDCAASGQTGSATLSGFQERAEIAFSTPLHGPAQLTFTASYRLFGRTLRQITTHSVEL